MEFQYSIYLIKHAPLKINYLSDELIKKIHVSLFLPHNRFILLCESMTEKSLIFQLLCIGKIIPYNVNKNFTYYVNKCNLSDYALDKIKLINNHIKPLFTPFPFIYASLYNIDDNIIINTNDSYEFALYVSNIDYYKLFRFSDHVIVELHKNSIIKSIEHILLYYNHVCNDNTNILVKYLSTKNINIKLLIKSKFKHNAILYFNYKWEDMMLHESEISNNVFTEYIKCNKIVINDSYLIERVLSTLDLDIVNFIDIELLYKIQINLDILTYYINLGKINSDILFKNNLYSTIKKKKILNNLPFTLYCDYFHDNKKIFLDVYYNNIDFLNNISEIDFTYCINLLVHDVETKKCSLDYLLNLLYECTEYRIETITDGMLHFILKTTNSYKLLNLKKIDYLINYVSEIPAKYIIQLDTDILKQLESYMTNDQILAILQNDSYPYFTDDIKLTYYFIKNLDALKDHINIITRLKSNIILEYIDEIPSIVLKDLISVKPKITNNIINKLISRNYDINIDTDIIINYLKEYKNNYYYFYKYVSYDILITNNILSISYDEYLLQISSYDSNAFDILSNDILDKYGTSGIYNIIINKINNLICCICRCNIISHIRLPCRHTLCEKCSLILIKESCHICRSISTIEKIF